MSVYVGDKKISENNGCPFPVGSVMIFMNDTDPSTIYSGTTWSQLADGKFLMNTTDTTKVATNLSEELPIPKLNDVGNHKHAGIFWGSSPMAAKGGDVFGYNFPAEWASNGYSSALVTGDAGAYTPTVKADSVYKASGKVRPASIGCRMWKRTA